MWFPLRRSLRFVQQFQARIQNERYFAERAAPRYSLRAREFQGDGVEQGRGRQVGSDANAHALAKADGLRGVIDRLDRVNADHFGG
jgi:hypothetical protein